MASQLTRAEVERIAELARLTLAPDDAPRFAEQLSAILEYARSIQQVDTTAIPSSANGASIMAREDLPVPSLDRRTVLEQAPDAGLDAGLFRVPKVL